MEVVRKLFDAGDAMQASSSSIGGARATGDASAVRSPEGGRGCASFLPARRLEGPRWLGRFRAGIFVPSQNLADPPDNCWETAARSSRRSNMSGCVADPSCMPVVPLYQWPAHPLH